MLQKCILRFEELAKLKSLDLEFDNHLSAATIQSDSHYLQRSLEHLLSNAIKFSKPDGTIFIRLEKEDLKYKLTIKDYGPGVLPAEESMLFQRFTKLSSLPTGGESGLGLGLYLVQYYLTALGGNIHYTAPHQSLGSTFGITLPLGH